MPKKPSAKKKKTEPKTKPKSSPQALTLKKKELTTVLLEQFVKHECKEISTKF